MALILNFINSQKQFADFLKMEEKKKGVVYSLLNNLFKNSPKVSIDKKDKIVIFSDLHMGDGGKNDDFKQSADLFKTSLKKYYLKKKYKLVLNGDVEELQRFDWDKIVKRWQEIYDIFDEFQQAGNFYKIIGNHDIGLHAEGFPDQKYPILDALTLKYKDNNIFLFHGHQASKKYSEHNALVGYSLRYLANPLGIKNFTVSHNSRKQYKIEKNAYQFASQNKIVSVIGHTHRPLFESLSKFERIRARVEQLCREYSSMDNETGKPLKKLIRLYKKELEKIHENNSSEELKKGQIYNSLINIPCLFNSGCVIGKRGMTCLEISNGEINLVHWFDKNTSKKYLNHNGYEPDQLEKSNYYRMIINKEKLNYIFTRINLLT